MKRVTVRGSALPVLYEDDGVLVLAKRELEGDESADGGLMSRRVHRLEYEHVEDGPDEVRFHPFRGSTGVRLTALPGRRAVLLHARRPVWEGGF